MIYDENVDIVAASLSTAALLLGFGLANQLHAWLAAEWPTPHFCLVFAIQVKWPFTGNAQETLRCRFLGSVDFLSVSVHIRRGRGLGLHYEYLPAVAELPSIMPCPPTPPPDPPSLFLYLH